VYDRRVSRRGGRKVKHATCRNHKVVITELTDERQYGGGPDISSKKNQGVEPHKVAQKRKKKEQGAQKKKKTFGPKTLKRSRKNSTQGIAGTERKLKQRVKKKGGGSRRRGRAFSNI